MPADVIEVDFKANRLESLSTDELIEEVESAFDAIPRRNIGEIRADIERSFTRYERQLAGERRRNSALRKQLAKERTEAFRVADVDVLRALCRLYVGTPVTATAIAAELTGREPTQSARVRTGLALSRLGASGRVRGARRRNEPGAAKHWIPRGHLFARDEIGRAERAVTTAGRER